jgi:hypothetical protein
MYRWSLGGGMTDSAAPASAAGGIIRGPGFNWGDFNGGASS